jgi:hypothetical protein
VERELARLQTGVNYDRGNAESVAGPSTTEVAVAPVKIEVEPAPDEIACTEAVPAVHWADVFVSMRYTRVQVM